MYDNFFNDTKKAIEYYEKAIKLNCTESMYNLAQLLLRNYEYDNAEKYLKMGADKGNKRCEYFLAAFYFRKSFEMFKSLANINYENTQQLVYEIRNLDFISDHLLISDFDIEPLKYEVIKEDVEPLYILDVEEDVTVYFLGRETRMAVDQGEVENIDV